MKVHCLLLFLLFCHGLQLTRCVTQAAPGDGSDAARIEQIAALGRVWGILHLFHPGIPAKQIRLDEATMIALQALDKKPTRTQFEVSLKTVLAAVDDPVTRLKSPAIGSADGGQGVVDPVIAAGSDFRRDAKPGLRRDKSIAVVDLTDFTGLGLAASDLGAAVFRGVLDSCSGAAGVIFDLRRASGGDGPVPETVVVTDYFFQLALREAVAAALLTEDLVMPTVRTRMHSGYASKLSMDTGGFHSGFQVADHFVVAVEPASGTLRRGVPPWIVLCNRGSQPVMPLVTALQAQGLVRVIQDGGEIVLPVPTHIVDLPDGFTAVIRLGETIQSNGFVGFEPDLRVSSTPDVDIDGAMTAAMAALRGGLPLSGDVARPTAHPAGRHSFRRTDGDERFPNREGRLLGLFRLWNVIEFFYPHRHSLDESWTIQFRRFIPRFERADDPTAYSLAIAELVSNLDDTRVTVHADPLRAFLGEYSPPIAVRILHTGTVVVTGILGDLAGTPELSVGDVIETIDGQSTRLRGLRLSRYLSASNDQGMRDRLESVLLTGKRDSQVQLRIRDGDGDTTQISVRRTFRITDLKAQLTAMRRLPDYGVLGSGNTGYLDLTRLNFGDVRKAIAVIAGTSGVVLDLRGPVKAGAWELVRHLSDQPIPAALFSRPTVVNPDPNENAEERFVLKLPVAQGKQEVSRLYRGRVVALIDGRSIGQSEHSCLLLEAASGNITYIGSASGGALGDLTEVSLPGGVQVRFPGDAVLRPDGDPLQRVGIEPDVKVHPTAAGIRLGIDEVLDSALQFLDSTEVR